ncbi:hypothetical protein V2G26_010756 [Clonostachys chloroleuca]
MSLDWPPTLPRNIRLHSDQAQSSTCSRSGQCIKQVPHNGTDKRVNISSSLQSQYHDFALRKKHNSAILK